jgi:hypothetical protein
MPVENEELNNEQNLEQQNNEQQETQNNEQELGTGRIPESLDGVLNSFIEKADGKSAAKAPENQEQQTPKLDANGKPVKDGQQKDARSNEQSVEQTQQTQQIPQASRKYGNLFYQDAKGTIFNAQGQVFAQSGGAARIFQKVWPYLERVETEAAGYKARAENYERATQAAKEAGLSLDEQSASLSLMVAYKKDPKAAINFLLQQAQGRGIDVSDIVQGGGGLSEATLRAAMEDMLEKKLERFAPFVQQTEMQAQQEQARSEAVQQYNEFMESKPDARGHASAIASVMESTNCDMQTAYYELKTDALSKGLDWTKPLAPQYQALRDKTANNARQPNGGRSQNLPDFNVRANGNDTVGHGSRSVANADDSWDSIIEGAVHSVRPQAN